MGFRLETNTLRVLDYILFASGPCIQVWSRRGASHDAYA